MRFLVLTLVSSLMLCPYMGVAQANATPSTEVKARRTPAGFADADHQGAELRYVVYLSRHGVRSPTGKRSQYNLYSTGAWPEWDVQPGYLTPHGYHLMELFGAFDRQQLTEQGLLQDHGCVDASAITIYADSDQRTRETAKAIAHGLMPECVLPVESQPEGTNDPLFHPRFHPLSASGINASSRGNARLAEAAIAGRIGGNPANLTKAYHDRIAMLDHILATCGVSAPRSARRISLFDVPAVLSAGQGEHLAKLKGPLNTASTLSENLLLEYAQGMAPANVGWGCVGYPEIESLMTLHTAATDFSQRTPEIAELQAANLLHQLGLSLQQAAGQSIIHGAIGRPSDRVLFLVGHDTNQENIAGALHLTWIIDGRRDDTPPGGAMVFELWRNRSSGMYSVRAYFTAQTLEQMRSSSMLTLSNPPERAPLFIPGCSGTDMSCPLESFVQLLQRVQRDAGGR